MSAVLASCSMAQHGRGVRYAPAVRAVSQDDYFQRTGAAKLMALRPYFVPQATDSSCSVASSTMVLNAALAQRRRSPVSPEQVMATDASGAWQKATCCNDAPGVDLDHLGLLLMQAFYGFGIKRIAVDVMHVEDQRAETVGVLTHSLELSEREPDNYFIIANFSHDVFLGSMEPIGHLSVVGAYDAATERVLILDVDVSRPEPYWVPLATFVKGMNTADDTTGQPRGYLVVRFP